MVSQTFFNQGLDNTTKVTDSRTSRIYKADIRNIDVKFVTYNEVWVFNKLLSSHEIMTSLSLPDSQIA